MAEFKLSGLLPDLIHGEIHYPAKLVAFLIHMPGHNSAQHFAHNAGSLDGDVLLARGHADKAAGLEIQPFGELIRSVGKELRNAAGERAVLVHLEPEGLAGGLYLDICAELVDILARHVAVGDDDGLDCVALGKGGKIRPAAEVCDILDHKVNTQIRLIRAVFLHGLKIRDALEGRGGGDVICAVFCENRRQNILEDGENIVLRGKGHLHIQLIKLTGRAVASGILVSEAWSYLEIPVKAGGHQQLLELLGGLRQGVELTRVLAGGDKIVPRTLWGGGCKYRGGYLKKAVLRHGLPQGGDHVATQDYILLHGGVSQIEIPVLQAHGLVRLAAAVYLKGQLVIAAAAQDIDAVGYYLNIAGGLLGVFAGALAHGAGDGYGGLFIDGLYLLHELFVLDDHLCRAVKIAHHHKGEVAAHLTDILHPTDYFYLFARVFKAKLIAIMGAGLKHWLYASYNICLSQ